MATPAVAVEHGAAAPGLIDAAQQQVDAAVAVVVAPYRGAAGETLEVLGRPGGHCSAVVVEHQGAVVGQQGSARHGEVLVAVVVVVDPCELPVDGLERIEGKPLIELESSGRAVAIQQQLNLPRIAAAGQRQVEVAVVVVVGPGQRASLDPGRGRHAGIELEVTDRVVPVELGNAGDVVGNDVVPRQGEVEVAVVVVVGPGEAAVVHVDEGFAVGLVQDQQAVPIAVQVGEGSAVAFQPGDSEVEVAVAVEVGPGEIGVADPPGNSSCRRRPPG